MARNKQERAKIDFRRTQVIKFYLKGWTQVDIARELGVSQATVSNDIRACRKEWRESRIQDTNELIDEELRRLMLLIREAMAGWDASKAPIETTKISQVGDRKKAERVVRQQSGDPRFLKVTLEAVRKRFELLGIDPAALADRNSSNVDRKQALLNWDVLFEERRKRPDRNEAIEQRIADLKSQAKRGP